MSSPIWSAGIESTGTVVGGASALNSGATTTSVGSTISTPVSFDRWRYSRQVSTWSSSSRLLPTSWPCAARKVNTIPPPISSVSALPSRLSITASLSLTFEPPSTTT